MSSHINQINYCVLIPTYNNALTLEDVILGVLKFTLNIIVVNDGSTDNTATILERYKGRIHVVSYDKNRGKGAALKEGFRKAEELGYEYAITIDSDGQHFPTEIPKFVAAVEPGQNILIIGNRNMTGENIPSKSIFGRKFSNFWVKLETGLELHDTQSGYRLYTIKPINRYYYFTNRYDFEIESLVRWVWSGYPVKVVTIDVYYPPPEERISHFKAFKDNFRISILNTVLVLFTLAYMLPKRLIKKMMKNEAKQISN